MSQYERDVLAQKIKQAFKKVKLPERKHLGELEELPDWVGKTRDEVRLDDLKYHPDLIWFSRKALHYYLPVIFTMMLESPERISSNFRDELIIDISRFDEHRNPNRPFPKVCESFTDEQKDLVIEFLERYEEFFPPELPSNLPHGHLGSAKNRLIKNHAALERAIQYWKGC
jgi:hypothetical protein